MLAKTWGAALSGIDACLIEVEVDVSKGLPGFEVVGLADTAVREARDRVRAALRNSDFELPARRITVSLVPADLRKEGSGFDLPIAVAVLAATGQVDPVRTSDVVFLSELSLDGSLRPVAGVLPVAIECCRAGRTLVVAPGNYVEASLVDGLSLLAPENISQLAACLGGQIELPPPDVPVQDARLAAEIMDFAEVAGQAMAKRALEIAAAGGHNVLMVGPPGSGKTLLARHLPSILPPMHRAEALEVTKIYSVAGLLTERGSLVQIRPFRSPHHSISYGGLIGGGRIPQPGEVSLAHHGVLFLDELPEFSKKVLEQLRQPLEDGHVTIARVNATLCYPAQLMLVAAMNPCPCGYHGDTQKPCTCSPGEIGRYRARISGPLLDRIDLQLEVPRLEYNEISSTVLGESSHAIRGRVMEARMRQEKRFIGLNIYSNSRLSHRNLRRLTLSSQAERLLSQAFGRLALSARAHDRIVKVARTIADLAGSENIEAVHIAEAVGYRTPDRNGPVL